MATPLMFVGVWQQRGTAGLPGGDPSSIPVVRRSRPAPTVPNEIKHRSQSDVRRDREIGQYDFRGDYNISINHRVLNAQAEGPVQHLPSFETGERKPQKKWRGNPKQCPKLLEFRK